MDKKEAVAQPPETHSKQLYPWQEDQLTSPEALLQRRDRAKAFYALILALLCYCLFLILIFLEIPQTYFPALATPTLNKSSGAAPKKSHPAPVRWTQPSQPQAHTPPLPPSPPLTQQKPISPPVTFKRPQRPSESPLSVLDPQKAGTQKGEKDGLGKKGEDRLPSEPAPVQKPRRPRSSKSAWIKKDMPTRSASFVTEKRAEETDEREENSEGIEETPTTQQTAAAQAWDQNFRTYLERRYGKPEHEEASSGGGSGEGSSYAKGNAERLGNELFLNKLVYAICDTSHQRPLPVSRQAIELHTITVWITLSNTRTITEISFEKRSPYPFINRYIEELIQTTSMPQLPFDWHEESLTVPLRVRIEVAPQMKEITLVPALT
ncbi:MAG: hypothetical protein UV38_C0002G0266 [candidate division TM6 bacterium GW2011_GWE2_42_60]|nr:MAG: hypothetical protein UV38_C0002G0266 [candidate division TM6 bacterium GW2011_GWE2_42_60]HBY05982.1 hypothetical protein [Candidatus Dependentiae bacterium]